MNETNTSTRIYFFLRHRFHIFNHTRSDQEGFKIVRNISVSGSVHVKSVRVIVLRVSSDVQFPKNGFTENISSLTGSFCPGGWADGDVQKIHAAREYVYQTGHKFLLIKCFPWNKTRCCWCTWVWVRRFLECSVLGSFMEHYEAMLKFWCLMVNEGVSW